MISRPFFEIVAWFWLAFMCAVMHMIGNSHPLAWGSRWLLTLFLIYWLIKLWPRLRAEWEELL